MQACMQLTIIKGKNSFSSVCNPFLRKIRQQLIVCAFSGIKLIFNKDMQCPVSHGFLVLLLAWALRNTSFQFPLVSLCVLSFKHQFQEKKLSLTTHFSRHGWGMHDKVRGLETSQLMNRF